ncbi:MAG: hypothetical protein AUI15_07170 [Actinobacteria bacterium 13_2_20CM_2_66_6]|nr:MAG: hypothetical protein AUI15_07170 [Actinobacteria bacterium 13_2_20CM_2_66_6]
MVVSDSIPVGGDRLDEAIVDYVKGRHNVTITRQTAEMLKIAVGSAVQLDTPLLHEVDGVRITSNEVAEAVEEPLRRVADAIRAVLAETPSGLAADVRERGLVLSGGAALLRGLAEFITKETGIPSVVADDPQTSVVRGTGLALDNFEVLRRNQSYLR